jgi:hypothetical protein
MKTSTIPSVCYALLNPINNRRQFTLSCILSHRILTQISDDALPTQDAIWIAGASPTDDVAAFCNRCADFNH